MSFNDYIKFVTQQVVLKIDHPNELKREERKERKLDRLPFQFRAFGMIPLSVSMLWKKQVRQKKE